jgi:lipopolysaccharide transport system ATP-binding protein
MSKAISVVRLSKAYQLGEFGTGTLSRDLERFFAKIAGKEDPYLKIGETNDRDKPGNSNIVWSLKDVTFDVEQGDAIGLIGRNGAGKSTLLKILSRITAPTYGSVKIKGRIASLLEVGTGFHPELTGRENIYLNGAILGMRRKEIARKFDEIVSFAGVDRYIDTPVKRYSSGMYVRLAFAVAAHLESEILIVDEVLAVGDAEFQQKCLGKMNEVSKGEGRTVLFVSHNMAAVSKLCNKGIILDRGTVFAELQTHNLISEYFKQFKKQERVEYIGNKFVKYVTSKVSSKKNRNTNLEITIDLFSENIIRTLVLGVLIKDSYENPLIAINNRHYDKFALAFQNVKKGKFILKLLDLPLLPGEYFVDIFLGDKLVDLEIITDALSFTIDPTLNKTSVYPLDQSLNKIIVDNVTWQQIK